MNAEHAQSGLHDIKALPEFSPLPGTAILAAATLLLTAFGLYFYFKFGRKSGGKQSKSQSPMSPTEQALADLLELEQSYNANDVQLRQLGSDASLILRTFLSKTLLFPATEYTNREVLAEISASLKKYLPVATQSQIEDIVRNVERLLKFFERITFAAGAEQAFDGESTEVIRRFGDARECILQITKRLQQERDRTASVVSHSSSNIVAQGETA